MNHCRNWQARYCHEQTALVKSYIPKVSSGSKAYICRCYSELYLRNKCPILPEPATVILHHHFWSPFAMVTRAIDNTKPSYRDLTCKNTIQLMCQLCYINFLFARFLKPKSITEPGCEHALPQFDSKNRAD